MAQRFKAGDRVRMTGYDFYSGAREGQTGVAALISGFHGKSVYPDPAHMLVFVRWDDGAEYSVPVKLLERVRESGQKN